MGMPDTSIPIFAKVYVNFSVSSKKASWFGPRLSADRRRQLARISGTEYNNNKSRNSNNNTLKGAVSRGFDVISKTKNRFCINSKLKNNGQILL